MNITIPPITIDVMSDVICPWCFLGKRRLERALSALANTVTQVRWRPFQLDPTIPEDGISRSDYIRMKFGSSKNLEAIHEPLLKMGLLEGIEFRFDRIVRTPNTINAHRLISLAHERNIEDSMVEHLFRLYFLEGADIGDGDVLAQAAQSMGIDGNDAVQWLAATDNREKVAQEIDTAVRMGVTGVPTFIIGNRFAVVGAQEPRVLQGAIMHARAAMQNSSTA